MEKSKFETLNPKQVSSPKPQIQNTIRERKPRFRHWVRISFISIVGGVAAILSFLLIIGFACKKEMPQKPTTVTKQKVLYHCPMHPTYISDKPGDCPICGMRLVPMEQKPMAGHSDQSAMDTVAGRTTIGLSLERQQLIGVRSEPVIKRQLENVIRTVGEIAYDPELYGAIAEYEQALKAQVELKESPWAETKIQSQGLLKASELKLRLLGLSDDQIAELNGASDKPVNLLLGTTGRAWVYAQIYEYEMGMVKPGQVMEVTSRAYPGQVFTGTIRALDPVLNAETRSLRVRAEVDNPGGLLKPQMFLDVKIRVPLGEALAVPEDAIIDTGERKIVFIDRGDGMFEPRAVDLGQEAEGYFAVLKGVTEGEKVVTGANFLIDSESKMKAALLNMDMGTGQDHSMHHH